MTIFNWKLSRSRTKSVWSGSDDASADVCFEVEINRSRKFPLFSKRARTFSCLKACHFPSKLKLKISRLSRLNLDMLESNWEDIREMFYSKNLTISTNFLGYAAQRDLTPLGAATIEVRRAENFWAQGSSNFKIQAYPGNISSNGIFHFSKL